MVPKKRPATDSARIVERMQSEKLRMSFHSCHSEPRRFFGGARNLSEGSSLVFSARSKKIAGETPALHFLRAFDPKQIKGEHELALY